MKKTSKINLSEVWPSEREIMERPARLKYVRKLVKSKGCVFCEAEQKRPSKKSLVLHKGNRAMVMLNKYPYNNGHLLVLPRSHTADLLELPQDSFDEINELIKLSVEILTDAYRIKNYNIGLNLGPMSGAGIPEHLHWHVIPRWLGDTNFFPLIAETKVIAESLDQTYERLRPLFKDIKV